MSKRRYTKIQALLPTIEKMIEAGMSHREIETELEEVIRKARISGLSEEEIRELFELIMEE